MTNIQKEKINVGVRVGDRVLVQGLYSGTVKYVGDLDSEYINDDVFVGVKLDDPGTYNYDNKGVDYIILTV